jgi:two-component system phosphate regulon sensor histidine kinase PhoR
LFTESDHKKDEIETLSEYILNLTNRLKKQNEDIKREQKTLSVVLNQMTDAVIIVDQEGFVKLANPAAKLMFEIQNGHEREKTSVEFLRNHQINELIEKCQKEHVQKEMSVEINLNKMFVHVIAKPLEEIYSNGVLLIIQDFTRIHQLEKIRSDFVSNVSHELRTPIASLKALSDTLQEGALEDPPAARRFLQRMNVEIDNLTQMVQELLELSKIESGRISLKRSYLNPKDLVNNVIDRMIVQAERSGLQLKFEVPDEISYVYADPDRITQVFINLIHNAIKFTEPGGSISILVFEEKTGVIFCVRDTGVGIERDLQVRIFERFYKTDKARTSGGTGLGLSIVKHIIEAHNGKVWVKSSPGEGSSFFFSLPKKV